MADSEGILLSSLSKSGVPIPDGVASVEDLTPASLFSICSHALRLIDASRYASLYPASLPEDSMPDQIKLCSELANAFNSLGFKPDLSFHKFLYPSKEDLYKMVRFLVGKVSEYSGSITADLGTENKGRCTSKERFGNEGEAVRNEEILTKFNDHELKTRAIESSYRKTQDDLDQKAAECNAVLPEESAVTADDLALNKCSLMEPSIEGVENLGMNISQADSQNPEVLEKTIAAKISELPNLDELELLKAAVEMVFDTQHTVEYQIEQLNEQLQAKRQKLKDLESEWYETEKPLREKRRDLEQSLSQLNPELSGKLARTREMESETEYLKDEIKRREEELSKLSMDLEKQPKQQASRRSYIERINEITKNSRKQDNDIQQILKDTRELQLESNTIQERLNRTYAIVNETIFREAKKDPVARQAYRLLTDIHESFENIAEKILSADRSRREAAEYEAKLSVITARSFNVDKLQADLDAIRKENDLLEQRLHNL
ncbi:uncharacterized protein LOC127249433 [Andrographis paniculata]|uniref:uncharacterized protein LOC127249433 n=1 Tax=Andrographis paniculata TaxID=175694 RepID=UPI0021E92FB4|nr:uncharacterized protein LOC127249433 [Andrographis paniculata]